MRLPNAFFTTLSLAFVFIACLDTSVPAASQGTASSNPAVPLEPAAAVADAFRSHSLVALGDNHGSNEGHAARLAIIRDSRLEGVLNDVVVEFGNSRYQVLIDRFISGGAVNAEELRHVWQDTSQVEETWDLPVYEEFFRTVRTINQARPARTQVRVLLGDPPVDWTRIRSREDLTKVPDRDEHAVKVIRTEVLDKGRRALIIYGDEHLTRKNTTIGALDESARGIVAQLEQTKATTVFSIHTESRADLAAQQPDVATWRRPSVAKLAGTILGQQLYNPAPNQRQVRLDEQFDAVLYLGHPGTLTVAQLTPALCADDAYVRMRSERLGLLGAPPTAPFDPADHVREACAFSGPPVVIPDRDARFTALVRSTLADGRTGTVDPARFAPELRPRLEQFFRSYAPRILGPLGDVRTLTLVGEATVGGKLLRRYRAEFDKGTMMVIVGVAPDGTIASINPRRE
jgi:hypothetical protein